MNDLGFQARELYPEEVAYLQAALKERAGCRWSLAVPVFVVFVLLEWVLVHSLNTWHGFGTYLLGLLAFLVGLVLLVIVLTWSDAVRTSRRIKAHVLTFLEKGKVEVCPLEAIQIAQAELHFFDELLFIVELCSGEVLFLREGVRRILWEEVPEGEHKFPCFHFEVYKDAQFLEGMVYPLSEKIKPILITPDAMAGFVDKYGEPRHMELSDLRFDLLIREIKACAFD
jgi:hypothetical protein